MTDVRVLPDAHLDQAGLLRLAAAAERPSEHPLARAIVDAATHRGLGPLPPVTSFTSTPGRGVDATVGEHSLSVGSPNRLLDATTTHAASAVADLESAGRTAVVVLLDGTPTGVIGIADRLRPDAATTITRLTALTGTPPLLLTGDNSGAAIPLAHQAGITDIHAGLLPAGKAAIIRRLEAAGHTTLLVGDGVNDAPALATAHTGIAMGRAGSDLALETADAVIIRDELATVPTVIALSRRARRLVNANLTIAATSIAVLVTWDLTCHLPLPLGVAGHEGSTIIVALNGLRLLRTTAWHRAAKSSSTSSGRTSG